MPFIIKLKNYFVCESILTFIILRLLDSTIYLFISSKFSYFIFDAAIQLLKKLFILYYNFFVLCALFKVFEIFIFILVLYHKIRNKTHLVTYRYFHNCGMLIEFFIIEFGRHVIIE